MTDSSKSRFISVLIAVFFAGLALWLTHPLEKHISDGLAYTRTPMQGWETVALYQGDHLQLYYHFWMAYDYVWRGGDFFRAPYEFRFKDMSIFTTRRLFISVPFVLFALFAGPVAAYNILTILSVVLCGIGMYLCAMHFFRSRPAAVVAGIIFACSPFTLSQLLGGHTNGFLVWTLPFIYVWLDRLIQSQKIRYAVYLLPVLSTFALIEYHLLYYSLLFIPPFALLTAAGKIATSDYKKETLKNLIVPAVGLCVVLFISAAILMYIKHVEIGPSTEKAGRGLSEVALNSPSVGEMLVKNNSDLEKNIYAGWPLIILCLLALLAAFIKLFSSLLPERGFLEQLRENILIFYASCLLVFTALISLGTTIQFPLYRACYKFVPYFNFSRSPSRFFVFSFFCAALLSAWVLYRLKPRITDTNLDINHKNYIWICIIVGIVILFDMRPTNPVGISLTDEHNPVYEFVGNNTAKNEKVLMLPLWPGDSAWSSIYQYYVTLSRVKMINGYYPLVPSRYITEVFRPLMSLNVGSMNLEQYEILKSENVRFVILHTSTFPQKVSNYPPINTIQRLSACPYLKFLRKYRDQYLFELCDPDKVEQTEEDAIITPITGMFFEDSMFKSTQAQRIDDIEASDGKCLFFEKDKQTQDNQPALSGRKQILPEGDYNAWVRVRAEEIEETDSPVLTISILDSTDNENKKTLAEKDIHASELSDQYAYFLISFSSTSAFQPELIMTTHAQADIFFDNLYMLENSQSDPVDFVEAEQSFSAPQTVIVDDEEARDNRAVASLKNVTGKTHFEITFGPYRRFTPGYYKISFRLRAENVEHAAVADLEVTGLWGRQKFASRRIFKSDLLRPDKYDTFDLFFELEQDEVLEFRTIGLSPSDLYIDCFLIEKSK